MNDDNQVSMELWTIKDVAQKFNVSVYTVRRNADSWGLRPIKVRTKSIWFRSIDVKRAFDRFANTSSH